MTQHPPIDKVRRNLVKGLASTPVAGLPLATILANPNLARAVANELEEITLTTKGGRTVKGTLAMPEVTPAPTLIVIHEWWGLNDHIKTMAAELAKEGYIALAVDLYGGKIATEPTVAAQYVGQVDQDASIDIVSSWANWLRTNNNGTGKVGSIGWCFGGGWSLNTSIATKIDATIVYYGNVAKKANVLANLKGPVLGHFGTEDRFINKKMVEGFEAEMEAAGKSDSLTVHWYTADHGFSNPTTAIYDQEDAQIAWGRSLNFFNTHLNE